MGVVRGFWGVWDNSCLPTRLEVSRYFDDFVDSLELSADPDWTTVNTLPVCGEETGHRPLPGITFWFYLQTEKQPKVKIRARTLKSGGSESESQLRL